MRFDSRLNSLQHGEHIGVRRRRCTRQLLTPSQGFPESGDNRLKSKVLALVLVNDTFGEGIESARQRGHNHREIRVTELGRQIVPCSNQQKVNEDQNGDSLARETGEVGEETHIVDLSASMLPSRIVLTMEVGAFLRTMDLHSSFGAAAARANAVASVSGAGPLALNFAAIPAVHFQVLSAWVAASSSATLRKRPSGSSAIHRAMIWSSSAGIPGTSF